MQFIPNRPISYAIYSKPPTYKKTQNERIPNAPAQLQNLTKNTQTKHQIDGDINETRCSRQTLQIIFQELNTQLQRFENISELKQALSKSDTPLIEFVTRDNFFLLVLAPPCWFKNRVKNSCQNKKASSKNVTPNSKTF